ncbi:MAG: rhodanese-related sulfurtransferase [Microscillaceae bacterium]|nr:rhodanese-related sulfurtransferase [Microscillaceae bacterium]MDW8459936.1 rhodanese-related sulfurtransferase [Cytophagales bacterium]
MEKSPYLVLLYYHFTVIDNPKEYRNEHHQLCLDLDLRGRIIIAHEGLNGTVSGTRENCEKYMQIVSQDERFKGIEFKVDYANQMTFQKLNVRLKDELVHAGLKHINPALKPKGKYIEPEEFKQIKNREDVVILDVRSNYEHRLGKFKNAVTLDIENFRDFPYKLHELEQYRDKTIITYCTGGIKCEKASAYLIENGFRNVYQLHGGIIRYGLETDGEDFEGKCYVFDNRIAIDINRKNPSIISQCCVCGTPSARMVNCANPECNLHAPMCEECGWKMDGACSLECKQAPKKRPYDGTGYYPTKLNGYNPRKNSIR